MSKASELLDQLEQQSPIFKKGDKVIVSNARSYDSLSPPEVKGTVDRIEADGRVQVTVGSGSMMVKPKDLKRG